MCGIHKLPVEVLAICVESLDVIDVLKLRSTCRDLYKSIEQFRSIWVDLHRRFSTLEHGSAPLHDLHAASLSEMRRCTIQSHRLDARWTSGRISLPPEATPFPVHPTTKRVVFLPGTDWIFCIGESGSVFLNSLSAPFAEPTGKQVVFSESKMLLHTSTLSWSDDLGSYILLVALARSDLVSRIHEGEIRIYLVEPISAKLVLVAAQLLDGRIFSVTFQKDLLCVTCWRRLEPIPFRVYIRRLVFQGDPATSLNTGTTVTVNKRFLTSIGVILYTATCIREDTLIIANPRTGLAVFPLPPFQYQDCSNAGGGAVELVEPIRFEEYELNVYGCALPAVSPVLPHPTRPGFSQCTVVTANACWVVSLGSTQTSPHALEILRTDAAVGKSTFLGCARGFSLAPGTGRDSILYAYSYPFSTGVSESGAVAVATLVAPISYAHNWLAFDDVRGRMGFLAAYSSVPPRFAFMDVL